MSKEVGPEREEEASLLLSRGQTFQDPSPLLAGRDTYSQMVSGIQ